MKALFLHSFIAGVLVASVAASFAQTPEALRQIGKIAPRSAKEIAASNWSIGCETLDRDLADYRKYKSYLGPLGAKAVRLQGGWAKTEKQPGVYDWKWLDEIVDDAISQGVAPWVELSYGNPLYAGGGGATLGDGLPHSPEALRAWDAWASALVQRYRNRVDAWEIWNEPEVTKEVKPAGYADLYIRTAQMIRAEAPQSKIYALGLAGDLAFTAEFLEILARQNKLGLVDAITFHGYPENPDDLGMHTALRKILAKYPAKIELRQGETGAPSTVTTGALAGLPWTELSQTKWNLRRMMVHHGAGIPMSLFTLSEFIYNDARRKGRNAKGLLSIHEDKSVAYAKPSYFAAQHVYAVFDDTAVLDGSFTGSSNASKSITLHGWRKQPGGFSIVAAWFNGAPVTETNDFTPVDFQFQGVRFKTPVYVDLRTGEVREIPASAWTQTENGASFRSIPVYDSPILIADKAALPVKAP